MYLSLRQAYGQALVELGQNKSVVVLEADLGKSTMSSEFQSIYPDRYFQMGIAEQNMASVAAGMALTGRVAFINSFAVFTAGRAYDQIRSSICIPALNVNICGSSAGLSDYGDGKTHQSVEDIATMRVLPNMTVLSPVDAVETKLMVRAMMEKAGPCYLRINRNELPVYTSEKEKYYIGKMTLLREGSDVVVFATGVMVSKAMDAAGILEKEGVSIRVVNVSTIKPLDKTALRNFCVGMKGIVTAEEHSTIGGLGSAICEALSEDRVAVELVGINDEFGISAENYELILEHYGLTSGAIVENVRKVLRIVKH